MNIFKVETWQKSLELMGSVAEDGGAFISVLRVNANEYENGDEVMIRKAFNFAIHLLKSSFQTVNIAADSASVKDEKTTDQKPDQIVTAERIHDHLETLGYRRIVRPPSR